MVFTFEDAVELIDAAREVFRQFRSNQMDVKSILRNIGGDALKVAPGAVGAAFGPAAGALATFAANAILQAEAKHTAAANIGVAPVVLNEAKKADVVSEITQNLPAILALLPKTDTPMNADQVSAGIGQLVDSFVAILKGTGHLPSFSPATPSPAPAVPAATLTDARITDRGADGSMTLELTVHVGA